jgi:cell division septal protein FtsQ
VEEQHGGVPQDLAGMRERLVRLEQRVGEIEREAERARRARRRSILLMLVAGALYVLVLYWEMTQAIP